MNGGRSEELEAILGRLEAGHLSREAGVDQIHLLGGEVVPAACAALTRMRGRARTSLVEALGRIGDRRAVDALAGLLPAGNRSLSGRIYTALAQIGGDSALTPVLRALEGDAPHARRQALAYLIGVDTGIAARALESLLGHSERKVRADTLDLLAQVGDEAIPALCRASHDPNAAIRRRAVELLQQFADAGRLAEVLDHPLVAARSGAIAALEALGPAAGPILRRGLMDAEPSIRARTVSALGKLRDQEAGPQLRELVRDADPRVASAACRALGRLADPEAPEILQWALDSTQPRVRRAAISSLSELVAQMPPAGAGQEDVLPLRARAVMALAGGGTHGQLALRTLRDPDPAARRSAARVLTGPALVNLLLQGARHEAPGRRIQAAQSLADLAAGIIPVLCEALGTGGPSSRRTSAAALGQFAALGAPDALFALAEDADPTVREAAAAGLEKVRATAVGALMARLELDGVENRAVLEPLGAFGALACGALTARLKRGPGTGRVRAAEALTLVARRRPCAALRGALPELRSRMAPWAFENLASRGAYRQAIQTIEAATAGLKTLPLPSAAVPPPPDTLPLPGSAPTESWVQADLDGKPGWLARVRAWLRSGSNAE